MEVIIGAAGSSLKMRGLSAGIPAGLPRKPALEREKPLQSIADTNMQMISGGHLNMDSVTRGGDFLPVFPA